MLELKDVFKGLKNKKIALYGLGTETQKVIKLFDEEFEIIGLIDGFKVDGYLYNKPIIDIKQCSNGGADVILAVARPGSCKAIAKRIGDFCRENEIELIDIRGKNLLDDTKCYLNYKSMTDLLQTFVYNHDCAFSTLKIKIFKRRLEQIQKEQKQENDSVVNIFDAYDIGYMFCAPIITDFVIWFHKQVRERNLSNVWFCARDGYLLKELYDIINENQDSQYFLTSRMAAIRSCVENKEDILYVDSMKFSGTLEENLQERFGIDAAFCNIDEGEEGILCFKTAILDKAKQVKKGYTKYVDSLNVQAGDIAFFDFVAKGTSQYFISRLVNNHIVGLYFLQLEPNFMQDKNLDIIPFYTNDELDHSAIFDNYYILETFLTSPDPSIVEFDISGNGIYTEESRTQEAILCGERVQQGIKDYFEEYVKQCDDLEHSIDKELDEEFLKLIHNVEIKDNEFLNLIIEDPFFNRMTNITDVL